MLCTNIQLHRSKERTMSLFVCLFIIVPYRATSLALFNTLHGMGKGEGAREMEGDAIQGE